ncbi:hypothetical protein [Rhizobium lusitanum]|uniref:Uncharacterized protein n=1 Tax=Rhizobium lusitanum TaxID=293958 RepID=A0A7X0MH81_9HYPH|nr:hypothetical protein [Rhizobium lusitanum]MBB6488828.1 hypothetical protein [Rhizobium lusitanum]
MLRLFSVAPAIVYVAALLFVVLSMLIVQPSRVSKPLSLHCENARYSDCRLLR